MFTSSECGVGDKVLEHYTFKFVICGNSNVGKTCIVSQFANAYFDPNASSTINVEFASKTVDAREPGTGVVVPVKVQVWDTAGQEKYRSMMRSYYRGSAAVLLIYDITDRSSFDDLQSWVSELKEHLGPQITVQLIGNKCDLSSNRVIRYEEGERFAKTHGFMFAEASAKTSRGIDKAFNKITDCVLDKVKRGKFDLQDGSSGVMWGPYYNKGKSKSFPKLGATTDSHEYMCC